MTEDVHCNGYSPVNRAFPSTLGGRFNGNAASLHDRVFSLLGTAIRVSITRTWRNGSGFVTHHGGWSKTSGR